MTHNKLQIYTDGGARGNPGPAGIGVVIWNGNELIGTYSKYIGEATNNQAEYHAILFGLEQAKRLKAKELDFFVDSELVASQLSRQAKIKDKELGSLFVKCWNMMIGFKKVEWHVIPREQNREADKLVNKELDKQSRLR